MVKIIRGHGISGKMERLSKPKPKSKRKPKEKADHPWRKYKDKL